MVDSDIIKIAMQQSAYDCSCTANDFQKKENSVHESFPSEKARKYLKLPHICDLVSYGDNIVACGQKDLLPKIKKYIDDAENISDCFETPRLYLLNNILEQYDARICFMAEYFLPDIEQIFDTKISCPYEIRILQQKDFSNLYIPSWSNALCKNRKNLNMLGVGAYENEKLVGLAGCSADCETMWQIGVDVLPEYRKQGIASFLTSKLAKEILKREKVPFYCAAWSNIKSVKNAIRSGFKPGWVEITAKSNRTIYEMLENKK